jgi:Fe-S-cluster containining protein
MTTPNDILDKYKKTCAYCDAFWKRVFEKFSNQCACKSGCSACCELQSVNLLEAFVIADHCSRDRKGRGHKCLGVSSASPRPDNACPFLADNRCRIYPARPIICRTHGLPLKSREFTDRIAVSCPFNFTTLDHTAIDDGYALDTDAVTLDLAKLNAAFCLLLGDVKKANERIALRDLANGKIKRSWFAL